MKTKSDGISLESLPQLPTPVRTDIPLYVQVYDVLYALIRSGQARPGDVLPGENALAAHFGVSRGTIRQAIQYLEEDGLLSKHQGRGSEISDHTDRQDGGLQNTGDVCREFCTVPIIKTDVTWTISGTGSWLSDQLHMPKGSLMVNFDVTFFGVEGSIALSQRLIPAVWLERCSVDPNSVEEMHAFAVDTVPQLVCKVRAEMMVHTQEIHGVSHSGEIPCFSISEIAYDNEDRAVGHLKNYLRSDCYRLYLRRWNGSR